jgi:hypothetical protein
MEKVMVQIGRHLMLLTQEQLTQMQARTENSVHRPRIATPDQQSSLYFSPNGWKLDHGNELCQALPARFEAVSISHLPRISERGFDQMVAQHKCIAGQSAAEQLILSQSLPQSMRDFQLLFPKTIWKNWNSRFMMALEYSKEFGWMSDMLTWFDVDDVYTYDNMCLLKPSE